MRVIRRLFPVVIVGLLFGVLPKAAGAEDKALALEERYTSAKFGFAISYPATWSCEVDDDGSVAFSGPKGAANSLLHFGVKSVNTAAAGGKFKNADALIAGFAQKFRTQFADTKLSEVQRSPYEIGGKRTIAHLLLARYAQPAGDAKIEMQAMVFCVSPLGGNQILTMTYVAPQKVQGTAVYNANLPTISAMVNSLALTKATSGVDTPKKDAPTPLPPLAPVRVVTESGSPAVGAGAVVLEGKDKFVELGRDGVVTFDAIPAGEYQAAVLWEGYRNAGMRLTVTAGRVPVIRLPDSARAAASTPTPKSTPAAAAPIPPARTTPRNASGWPVTPRNDNERFIVERVNAMLTDVNDDEKVLQYEIANGMAMKLPVKDLVATCPKCRKHGPMKFNGKSSGDKVWSCGNCGAVVPGLDMAWPGKGGTFREVRAKRLAQLEAKRRNIRQMGIDEIKRLRGGKL